MKHSYAHASHAVAVCLALGTGVLAPRAAGAQVPVTLTAPTGGGTIAASAAGVQLLCGDGNMKCTASFPAGTTLHLSIRKRPTDKQYGAWTGQCYTQDSTCTLALGTTASTQPRSVGYLWFPASAHLVTLNVPAPQQGATYLAFTPDGSPQITCRATPRPNQDPVLMKRCSMRVPSGTSVTAWLQPDSGVSFQQWTGAPGGNPKDPCWGQKTTQCTFTATDDASFAVILGGLTQVTVTSVANGFVQWDGGNCGEVFSPYTGGTDCSSKEPEGKSVGVRAVAKTGYVFTGWSSGQGGCVGFQPSCTVSVNATPATLTPAFSAQADAYLVELQVKTDVRPNQITCDDGFLLKDGDLNSGIAKSDVVKLCARYGPRDSALTGIMILQNTKAGGSCGDGYTALSGDLNKGAGGDFLNLCVSHASSGGYVADVVVHVLSTRPQTANDICDANASLGIPGIVGDTTGARATGETFARFLSLDHVGAIPGDLNGHAGGNYVFLCLKGGK